MKIINEDIANIKRALDNDKINIVGSMPLVMADAVVTNEKTQKDVDKEMEQHNKNTRVKLNKVIGAEKQPVPDLPEEAKSTLDESVFEAYGDSREYTNMLYDYIENGTVDAKEIAKDLIYWCSEDDIKHYMKVNDLIWEDEDDDELDLDEDYIDPEETVKRILNKEIKPIKSFTYISSNGNSGEVKYKGTSYAWRKKPDGSYKVMRADRAGWNWSETLFKDESLKEGRGSEKLDLFDQIYIELSMDVSHEERNRKISRKEFQNSKRFRFDDEIAFDSEPGRKSSDRRTGRVEDNKFILNCKDDEQLNFAKQVADLYGVNFSNNGLKAIIEVPWDMIDD